MIAQGMKPSHWAYAYLLTIAGLAFCLDQGSKLLVRMLIPMGESWMPLSEMSPYVQILHSGNSGMALGLAKSMNGLFLALSEIACISILVLYPQLSRRGDLLLMGGGLGLVLGGAAGNLVDRAFLGYVTDIVLVRLFPVFNFADMCILLGAVFIALGLMKSGGRGWYSG